MNLNPQDLNPQDLQKISRLTLEHYNQRAEAFWEGTRDHDVSQNIAALLRYIDSKPPFTILDFGCGPGRDLKAFAELGHNAVGLEGAPHFAAMARVHSGCDVWQQDFLELDLPDSQFDGVFANASLFHVPSQELPRVLLDLQACLKPGGVLFSSNPRGRNAEGWNGGRYGAISILGAAMYRMRDSSSSLTITVLPACRANNSPGWRVFGASWLPEHQPEAAIAFAHSSLSRIRQDGCCPVLCGLVLSRCRRRSAHRSNPSAPNGNARPC
jgi:SAM-dependent methyltransferase